MFLTGLLRVGVPLFLMWILAIQLPQCAHSFRCAPSLTRRQAVRCFSSASDSSERKKGKLLVLGGTGFLGQTVCKRAIVEGYDVTSLSRRGLPPTSEGTAPSTTSKVDYRQGDARKKEAIENILNEGGYTGVIHCIGLLFDDASGLGSYNRFVSGSGSLPDSDSTYDTITRLTAFNAIEATIEYAKKSNKTPFPFCFTSAAEAGWPEVAGLRGLHLSYLLNFFVNGIFVRDGYPRELRGRNQYSPIP